MSVADTIQMPINICIAPTQPFPAALGPESRVCYPGNTADRQTQWALTYYNLSQSTANQNGKLIHCWDSNLWSSGCWRTSLTTESSPTQWHAGCCMSHWHCLFLSFFLSNTIQACYHVTSAFYLYLSYLTNHHFSETHAHTFLVSFLKNQTSKYMHTQFTKLPRSLLI
jgi:hypothetical protein